MLDWLKATGCIFALFLGVFALASAAQAGPEDGRIVNGSGSISQSGTHTDIRQNSDFLATHWGSFNIAAHESVQAHQPAASSRLLIRVDGGGGGATNIAGNYTSNGITILENRNGVQFSRGAIVNVGGLLATSSRISGVSGANWQLDGVGGAVVNHGQITAGAGGAILAAVKVQNTGDITAKGGDVALGAGSSFTVDFAGSMVGFEITKAASGASITNSGKIEAQGGIVSLSAQEAQAVRTNVVSVGGVVKATRLERRGGVVYLSGGTQGIAEVSGDVSASKKVQTTGEYVVVKEGALLKAPEILVGGDFQGGGDVPTSRRTLVERGALLDAGAKGRVIVWSDETTWFNGDISAPDGFAEVSGKETLASVHLAGIDVGELLLDPADIIIAAAGTGDAVTADIAAADPGMTLTLDVATINTFAGALSLAASDTIMVDGEINKPTGNLTLIAGGVLTLGANITTSAGDLALTGASIELGGTITLTGGAITLTGAIGGTNNTFSAAASGVLTLNSNINTGTSDLTLAGGMGGIALGGDLLLNGGNVIITGAIAEAATSTDNLTIAAVDDITLNSNIDLGMGALRLTAGIGSPDGNIRNGGTAPEIMAGSLHLQTDGAFANALFATSSRVAGAVEIRYGTGLVSSAFEPWVLSLGQGDLSVRAIDGVTPLTTLLLDGDIGSITRTEGVVDIRWLTLSFSNDSFIQARAITLHADALTGSALSLTATDGALTFRNLADTGAPTLAANVTSVTLGQNAAFGTSAPFTTIPATVTQLTLTTAADQIVHNAWMVASGRSLSITTEGDLFVNSDINVGNSNDLTLDADGGITLGGTNVLITLTAEDITLDGVIEPPFVIRDLTLTASGGITLRSDINLGTGDLSITSTFTNPALTAPISLIRAGGTEASPAFITLSGGNVTLANTSGGGITGGIVGVGLIVNALDNIFLNAAIDGVITALEMRADQNNNSTGTITNDGTARRLRVGAVFLQQAGAFAETLFTDNSTVSGSVDLRIRTRVLQNIHAWMAGLGNGDFSLHGVDGVGLTQITTSAAFTRSAGEVDLRATSITLGAPLTGTSVILRTSGIVGLGVAIHATSGDITFTAITDTGDPATGLPTLVNATSFSLTQTTALGALNTLPFTFTASEITAITISTRSDQFVQDWMIAVDRDLTITSSERVVVNAAIGSMAPNRNIGAGALSLTSTGGVLRIIENISTTGDLTLSGNTGINLNGGTGTTKTLTGANVTLSGAAVSNRALTITASSGIVTISGGINTGTSDLSLSTGSSGAIALGGDVVLTGGVITLLGAVLGTNHGLSVFANGNIFLGGAIALGSGALTLSAGENGTGNISFLGIAQNQLTVGALTLRQSDAFGNTQFDPDSRATGAAALRLRTAVDQPIHLWMTLLGNGNFSLRGVEGVTLTSIITTAALTRSDGPVDLRATTINLGGDVTGNIVGSSDVELVGLTLTATTINLGGDVTANIGVASNANIRLTGVINGSANNRNFSATASRMLTISNDINIGMGTLTLTGVGLGVTGSILLDGNITFTGGEIRFIGDFRPSAADINPNLTVNASTSISIRNVNLGTGNLILNNTGATATALGATNTTWTTGDITLTGALDASADNRNLNIIASGVLTLNNDINLGERNLNINAMGGITLGGNVTLTSRVTILRGAVDGTNGNHNFTIMDSAGSNLHNDINLGSGTFTLANTGSGQVNFSIVGSVGAPLTIEAGNINFMRSNDVVWVLQAGVVAQGADLTLRATGDITFQGTVINLGPGRLEMSADNEGNGTGTIIAANTPQILVGSLVLRHAAAFPADFMADDSAITGAVDLRITGAMVTQAIHPWMDLDGTSFTLRGDEGEGARAAVVLTAITLPAAIDFGTTDIDLQAAAITLTAATTLTGGAISLTGALTTATNNLTITASGLLTLNSGIDLGTGALIINAGNRINVPTSGTTITAGTISIEFTDRLVQSNEVGFTPAGGTSTFGNVTFEPPFTPTEMPTFAPSPCLVTMPACEFGDGTTEDLIVDSLLEAMTSITIDIGTGALTFGGEGAITITSPIISITAGSIDIGTRSLTITAAGAGGTITLVGVTSITGTGAASLSLDATTIAGLRSALTVDVPSISLAQEAAFGGSAPFTIPATGISSLALTTAADQTVRGWMVATGRSLSLTSTGGRITAEADINTGSGDIILNGARGLSLGLPTSPSTITLTGRAVSLTGAINDNIGFTVAASGVLTLNNNINLRSGSTLNLTGTSGIILGNNITISGAVIDFNGAIDESAASPDASGRGGNNSLTITATRALGLDGNINLGDGNLTLSAGVGGSFGNLAASSTLTFTAASVRLRQDNPFGEWTIVSPILILTTDGAQSVFAWMLPPTGTNRALSITSGGDITVGSSFDFSTVDLTLTSSATIALGGDLTALSIALRASAITRDSTDLVITATTGGITGNAPTLDSTVTALTLTQNSAFGSSAPFTFDGTTLTSLTLQTAAPQTAYSWMGVSGSDLSLTSTGGDITIGGAINVGTDNSLTLIASGNILPGTPRPRLIADTVNLELTGADSVFTSRPFLGTSQIDTLTITTAADQTYLVWMAPPAGTNRNLTITAPRISIGSTAINLGMGDLTLTSDTDIRLTNTAGLTITAGDFTFSAISVNDVDVNDIGSIDISLFAVVASGDIMISAINLPTARVDLRAGGNITVDTRFESIAGEPGVSADILLLQQAGAFAEDLFSNTASRVSGAATLRITTAVPQTIHPWMTNLGGSTFSLRGEGAVLTSITTAAAADFGTTAINLRATAITLGGDLTAGAVALRTNTITVPGANLVAIHATAGDITAITITDMGGAGQERPTLTTSATSLSLEQTSAFGGRITLPFIFDDAVIGTALTLSTRSEQLVRGWMIRDNINLTITSSDRVLVNTAIGAGNRSLGGGDLTLTSTGAAVRIVANITTGGAITLSGGTGGINLNSTPTSTGTVTLTGAAVTLTGNALSNRALIITATSGALTLSGAINTGTSALTLSGSSGIALGGALTLTGGSITINNAITGAANASLTITADTLTLNNDITLTGTTSILALRSRQGAITGGAVLRAPTVRLRQVAEFADTEPFNFSTTGALLLITDANQDVHDWMIALDRNLTVRSSRRVRVMGAAIGSGNRDLGTGSLTLRSTGGIVRILADISTTGSLTLIGPGTIVGTGMPVLTASTVSLSQADAFAETALFMFGAATGSLEFTTTARQDVHDWMIREDTNLTVTSSDRVRVLAAIGAGARNLGNGSLTLTSTGGDVRIVADITTTGDVTLDASGILTISSDINIGTNALTLTSGGAISNGGVVVRPLLTASTVSFTQDAAFDATRLFRFGSATGSLEFTTTVNQDVHNWMIVPDTNLTVTSSNRVRVLAAIGSSVTGRNLGNGNLTLTSTGRIVRIVADISTTGDVTLTASGTLTISNDITLTGDGLTLTLSGAGAISNGGNGGANRPALTASTVSLAQDAAFATTGPFRFGSATGALEFTTTMNQDVHNWMIRENTNLTVESSNRVRVLAAIGSGVTGRNLGGGSLTLTSTGRIVRIVADISTTGDATITASSILTINNDINIGTGALTLTGASFAIDTSVDLAAGSHSFTPNMTCNTGTSPSCTVNTP